MKISICNFVWVGFSVSQRRSSAVFGGLILLLICSAVPPGCAIEPQPSTIVSPAPPDGQYGNFGVSLNLVVQQVFANTEFASAPSDIMAITGVAFRWDDRAVSAGAVVLPSISIGMSTFSKPLSQMDPFYFEENRGKDYRSIYYATDVQLIAEPPGSPDAFNIRLEFAEPFYYDRRGGHLVLDVAASRPRAFSRDIGWDAHGGFAYRDRVHNLNGSALGSIDIGGLVTQFTITPIPEPAVVLLGTVGTFLLYFSRKLT